MKTTKVRIYPTDEQLITLAKHFGCTQWLWNHCLSVMTETYKMTGKGVSALSLKKRIPILKVEHEWLKKHERNLKHKQRKLTRRSKDSKNRNKARLKVVKVHSKIARIRKDFHHKLSRKIVSENPVIVVEKLLEKPA